MTQIQLETLSEDERDLLFYVVNVISPTTAPKIEYDLNTIKWMRHEMLTKKLLDAFNKVTKDAHPIYSSMLAKLGVFIQIQYEAPPIPTSTETSTENTGSSPQTPSLQEDLDKTTSPFTQSICPTTETNSNTTLESGTFQEKSSPAPDADSNTADTNASSV